MKKLMDFIKDPKYRQTLKKIVSGLKDLDEKYKNDDLYDDYYEKWQKTREFEYSDIGASPQRLHQLNINGVLETTYNSSSHTIYKLAVDEDDLNERLENFAKAQEARESKAEDIEEIPENIFNAIVGYEDVKDMFMRSIESDKQVNILLEGAPATAKTLFMAELDRLPKSLFVETGGRTSQAGLADKVYGNKPRFLMIDEIADINSDAYGVLKSLMENGVLDETISGGRERIKIDVRVYGTTNYPETIPYEVRSRFISFHFDQYTKEEFLDVCTRFLVMREDLDEDLSRYISKKTWKHLQADVREARSIARLLREETREDVDKCISTLRKY